MAAWQNPENFALWLALVLGFVILLVGFFIFFTRLYFLRLLKEQQKVQETRVAYQQQLLEDSIKIQERERGRIAMDLHDNLIAKINIALISLHTEQPLEYTSTILQDSMVLARQISHNLSPPLLEDSSLYDLMEAFVHPIRAQLQVKFSCGQSSENDLDSATKLQLFRIFQELVNNALKHAQARTLMVHLHFGNQWIGLWVQDDGQGFDVDTLKRGLGFKNIILRSDLLQGHFHVKSQLQQGSSFLVIINRQNYEQQ
ncbi:MAG: sensor histidine kinase [Aureispira sp.]